MVGKYANHNPDQHLSQTLPKTFCKPLKHINKKVCDEGTNQPIKHNKEAFDRKLGKRATGERLPNVHNQRFANTWSTPTE